MKTCSNPNCARINPQPFEEFHRKKLNKDGLQFRCKSCTKHYKSSYYRINADRISLEKASWYRDNVDSSKSASAAWVKANPERKRVSGAAWRKSNPDRIKAQRAAWQKNNPGKVNMATAKRRADKLRATPKWLTKEQKLEMRALYIEAARLTKETGIKHHVDHIIPLQGENVSGLHVPWNLQILTAEENRKKGNKIIA